MKTETLINLTQDAISNLIQATHVLFNNRTEDEEGFINLTSQEWLLLLGEANVVRELANEWPEDIATDEFKDKMSKVYPHLYENPDDSNAISLNGFQKPLWWLHTFVNDERTAMNEAKDKYGFSS